MPRAIDTAANIIDLAPPVVDLRLMQGTTLAVAFVLSNKPVAPATAGAPIDLTGSALTAAAVRNGVTVPLTVAVANAVAGSGSIGLTDEQTAVMTPGDYAWDLHMTDSTGAGRTMLRGTLSVLKRR